MQNIQPIFDQAAYYRIEVRGQVDVDWLKSFDGSAEISFDETNQVENVTIFKIHTDQAGIVGLVRRLHGLGLIILQVQIITDGGKAAEMKKQL